MLQKLSELREAIGIVAGPRTFTDTRDSWLARAGRRAGVSFRTVRSIWYGQITDPEHKMARRITEAAKQHATAIEATRLADLFTRTATAMRLTDEDFYRTDIAALVDVARKIRALDRARNDPAKRLGEGDNGELREGPTQGVHRED